MAIQVDIDWKVRAACRGPQARAFFPPPAQERRDDKRAREEHAKQICHGCVVRTECLGYALEIREPHGIWGGLTEIERRTLLS